ncbi:MAG: ATPase domain-containing protein [Candidatus Pacearchaeota archaeon]|jgi:KaiC/GvpD/RAD55 family RecA-like ATPase
MEQTAGVLEVNEESSFRAPPKIKLKVPIAEISNNDSLPDLDSPIKSEEKSNDLPDLIEEKPVEEIKIEQPPTEIIIDSPVTITNPAIESINNPIKETSEQVQVNQPTANEATSTEITNPANEPINNQVAVTTSEEVTVASTEAPIKVTSTEITNPANEPINNPVTETPIEQTQEITSPATTDPLLTEETQIIQKINELENSPETISENLTLNKDTNVSEIQPTLQENITEESNTPQVETKVYVDSTTKNELDQLNPPIQETPVTPKKRGRKPKPKRVLTEEELIAQSTPKKRGRKPKIKIDETTISTTPEPVIQNSSIINPAITENITSTDVATNNNVITETPVQDSSPLSTQESILQSSTDIATNNNIITETPVQDSSLPITQESSIENQAGLAPNETNNQITTNPRNITKNSSNPESSTIDEDLISRTPTGISGFDELIEGGFPKNSSTLICGGPGSGKTIFCLQYLINGATQFNEKGLYVTFEQRASDLRKQAKQFGWDIEDLEYKGMIHIISLPVEKITTKTIQEIQKIVKRDNIKRLIIDSLSTLIINAPIYTPQSEISMKDVVGENIVFSPAIIGDYIVKRFVYGFIEQLRSLNTTNLLISEASQSDEYITRDGLSEFVCDGVVLLKLEPLKGEFSRSLKVLKMRATKNNIGIHPVEIEKKGIILD